MDHYSSGVCEQDLFRDIQSMEWSQVIPDTDDALLNEVLSTLRTQSGDFDDISDSSFHGEDSLLLEENALSATHFFDVLDVSDVSFHEGDSLIRNLPVDSLDGSSSGQSGAGRKNEFDIRILGEKQLKTMGAVQVQYELEFRDDFFKENKKMVEVKNILKDAFEEMLKRVKKDLRPGDIIKAGIQNDHLDIPVFIPCRPMEEMNAEVMLESLMTVLNSNEDIPFDSSCRIDVGAIKYPRGGTGVKMSTVAKTIADKRSIIKIRNFDNMCLIRAVLVSLANACKTHKTEFDRVKTRHPTLTCGEILVLYQQCPLWYYHDLIKNHKGAQDSLTKQVCERMNIVEDEPLTYAYIPQIEDDLQISIYVISIRMGNAFSYISPHHDEEQKKIFLLHDDREGDGHFHSIASLAGFFCRSRFCKSCLKPYEKPYGHKCKNHCNVCFSDNCPIQQKKICPDCHQTCRSGSCYERHKSRKDGKDGGYVPCDLLYKCPSCKKTILRCEKKPEDHQCGYYTCKSCRQYVDTDHLCFARKHTVDKNPSGRRFIFADIEASQRDEMVQCDWGYVPRRHADCDLCTSEGDPCISCRLCQNCRKSHCGKMKHTMILAVCQTACPKCENDDLTPDSTCNDCGDRCSSCKQKDKKTKKYITPPCADRCGHRERVFHSLYDLGSWIFSEHHKGFTVLFHNLSYDGQFLMQYLLSQAIRPSSIIYRGSKIQMFGVSGLQIRVIDSFNFLPMALAKLPEAFQLESLAKGFFPHFFTCEANRKYVGPYPPAEAYGPNAMSLKGREVFYRWYETKVGEIFDFKKEILKYCRSDVDILRRACLKFKNLLLGATGEDGGHAIDAFDSCTIASLCMDVFKTKFLPEKWNFLIKEGDQERWVEGQIRDNVTFVKEADRWIPWNEYGGENVIVVKEEFVNSPIARAPPRGYPSRLKYSRKSICWLELLKHRARVSGVELDIWHALTGRGEYRVPGTRYFVDGYQPPNDLQPRGVAYEFHGCLYHGCKVCFKNRDAVLIPNSDQTASELFALTKQKEKRLRELGLKVVSIWEHEFDALLVTDIEARAFIENLEVVDRLDPRESLMGGRTNGCVLYKRTRRDEKIKYVDFTSLYPFVNKTCRYPVGHPEIITCDFGDIDSYFGLAKVKILPPRRLFHPVLGYREGGKLTFPLCRTCVERQQQEPCTCSDAQRALTGTYCTPELIKAVEKGYKILKMYEVYHWRETTQYDPVTKTGGLFSSYINMFLKIKQEASGRPKWVKTESDLERYITMYEKKEGLRLDPEKIEVNPGLRSLAKLLLNSFWGKFGQNMNLTQTHFVHDSQAHKLFGYMTDPTVDVVDFNIVDDENLMLSTRRTSEEMCSPGHTNVFLASFTTCWARLQLYELLERLQTRVLYWDTDSVIYVTKEGEWEPPIGDYLGELTNELEEGDWITEFVCNGPKNYAYQTQNGKSVCKVKGFSLNYNNSKIINLESMRDAMFNREDPRTGNYYTTNPSRICREKVHSELYCQDELKQYSAVYTKRVVQSDLSTLPYGY